MAPMIGYLFVPATRPPMVFKNYMGGGMGEAKLAHVS